MSERYYRTTRARETGTTVTTAHADDLGLDIGVSTYDGTETTRWYNICDEHGAAVGHQSLSLARSFASCPSEWCDECREAVAARAPRPRLLCEHEAGHTVMAWLAGVTVMETVVTPWSNHAAPDWKHAERSTVRWPERDRYERLRVTAAGLGATLLMNPELPIEFGAPMAADDRRYFEFAEDDWDVAVAEARDDLAPYRHAIEVVTQALFERGTLGTADLEALRAELELS